MSRRILFAVTDAITAVSFLRGQASFLRDDGFEVHIATGVTDALRSMAADEGIQLHDVPLTRGWGQRSDVRSLRSAARVLRSVDPDILSYSTPKASLVWALASLVHRPRVRVYQARGLRLEGISKAHPGFVLLWLMELVACRVADATLCVSPSLREALVKRRLVPEQRAIVLGRGSSNGVDVERFMPAGKDARLRARADLGLDVRQIALVFVGRLARDKGLTHLLDAMTLLDPGPDVRLCLVGWPEPDLDVAAELSARPAVAEITSVLPPSDDVAQVMAAADLFVLPSMREGLSNVLLEAQSAAVACVTTTATGCADAVSPDTSALVVPTADPLSLAGAISSLVRDDERRYQMGLAGRRHVQRYFRATDVWARHAAFYAGLCIDEEQEIDKWTA